MDFGLADSLVCSNPATSASNNGSLLFPLDNNNNNNSSNDDEANDKQKWCGFGFMKQERAIHRANEGDDFRDFKTAKIAPLQRSNGCDYLSDGHQKMLSFSSPSSQAMALPYYHQASTVFGRNTGYGFSGMNGANMQQGVLSGVRGPFTPSQWMELEHQALIYKYITANVPIPSYLLNPIRKAFECAGFPSFPGLRSNALGWGAFHLGFASTDPEPGRCRRTDGKKWRCSRDAVADQKYCERHMNRGRHRSRKPVEGQSGHSASGPTTTTSGKAAVPPATSKSVVVPAGGASSSTVVLSHHRQLGSSNNHHPSGIPNINRNVVDKEHKQFSITKHHPYSESEFGLVCSDSLLNPLNKSSSLVNLKSYGTPDNNLNDHKHKSSHPLRQFMDEWPKNQSDDTQLSISITSDFMSSSSSPMNEKTAANSPPRLSRELEMGLCLGPGQANWVPISWEPSMGGPLGEVLHTTTNVSECKNTKPLNLIDTWDNSHRMALSPTGVLQRSAFGSLSNSSAGSSLRAETGLCNGLVIMNPSLPAL